MNPLQINSFLYYFSQELKARNIQVQLNRYDKNNLISELLIPDFRTGRISETAGRFPAETTISLIDGELEEPVIKKIYSQLSTGDNLTFIYRNRKLIQGTQADSLLISRNEYPDGIGGYRSYSEAICTRSLYPRQADGKVFDICVFIKDAGNIQIDNELITPFEDLGLRPVFITREFSQTDISVLKKARSGFLSEENTTDMNVLIQSASAMLYLGSGEKKDNVPYEILASMACGTPVITNLFFEKYTGLIADLNYYWYKQKSVLKNLVFEILTDRARKERIKSEALRLINKNYAMYHRVNDFIDFCGISSGAGSNTNIRNGA
jgi:glycosyltransferase involved in cell wall biosynthesis